MEKGRENKDFLKEDGYLSVESCKKVNKIIFHPNLNVMIIITDQTIIILDINSGVLLQQINNGNSYKYFQLINLFNQKIDCINLIETNKAINGRYLIEHDKILFWNDKNMGMRSVYPTSVLLLETILQAPIHNTDNVVKVEILLSEAVLLYNSLISLEQQGVENSADITNELVQKYAIIVQLINKIYIFIFFFSFRISEAQRKGKKGIKAQKVNLNHYVCRK